MSKFQGTCKVMAGCATVLLYAFSTGCGKDAIFGGDIAVARPVATAPTPADLATNVSTNTTAFTAEFSERMLPLTGGASFTVSCAAPCVSPTGTVALDSAGDTASFTLDGVTLEPLTEYTATITGATSAATGLALATPFVWTFTTGPLPDSTKPRVSLTVPATTSPGPTAGAATNSSIVAVFTEDMAPSTINGTSFTVTCEAPCVSPAGTVSYVANSRAAVFRQTLPLAAATTYTATITTTATDVAGNALAGNQAELPASSDYIWTFTTASAVGTDTTAPTVTKTVPATTSPGPTTGAPINGSVSAVFSEDMAPGTFTATSFTLTCVAPCVSPTGTVSYVVGSKTALFTPASALAPSTTYTATITTAATDLAGNALSGNEDPLAASSNYVWTFTTGLTADTTRPVVLLTIPATTIPGPTTGAATNTAITARFSEDMLPSTITPTSFTVTCALPCTSPTGTESYVVGSRTAIFTPQAVLAANTTYTVTITAAATDIAGNTLAGNQGPLLSASDYIWTFTTGAAPDLTAPTVTTTSPLTGATGVCTNRTISATFSEPMDPLTITTSTFTLAVTAGASVSGVVEYDALTNIATFNPVLDLTGAPATNYTATIVSGASGVKDLAGNPLAVDRTILFTTNSSTCTTAPALGAADPFGSFGGNATVTNTGLNTIINGDLGVNASSTTITGFRDSGGNVYTVTTDNNGLVNGLVYTQTAPPGSVAGAAVTQARVDALTAFNSISPASLPGGIDVSSLAQCPTCGGAGGGPDELAGRTLPPGVYMSTTGTYDIGGLGRTTANLTLDAGGDADAVWVFQSGAGSGTLNVGLTGPATPAVPIKVLLVNGAQSKNVFWYAPAGATIGTGSTMEGTILSDASITFSTTGGSPPTAVLTTLNGRAIALTAAVTMTNTIVNVPAP
jgi:hypothetical protein